MLSEFGILFVESGRASLSSVHAILGKARCDFWFTSVSAEETSNVELMTVWDKVLVGLEVITKTARYADKFCVLNNKSNFRIKRISDF